MKYNDAKIIVKLLTETGLLKESCENNAMDLLMENIDIVEDDKGRPVLKDISED